MVDALHQARRALRRGGILIDARPDSRVLAKVEHAGRVVGYIHTQACESSDDKASDRAVARVKREGLFRRVRAGRFWDRVHFANLAELRGYLSDHLRFEHRIRWRTARHDWGDDPLVLERAIRFEVLT